MKNKYPHISEIPIDTDYLEYLKPVPFWEKAATIVVYLILAVLVWDLLGRAFPWLF